MGRTAILRDSGNDNELYTRMWLKAFSFWDLQFNSLNIVSINNVSDFAGYDVVVYTGIDVLSDDKYRILDNYVENGGCLLISGDLPDRFGKYFNWMKVRKIQRYQVHRCIKIKKPDGFGVWNDGEILFFTNTCSCGGLDFVAGDTGSTDAEILAVSQEMSVSDKVGVWEDWRGTNNPAVMLKRHGRGKILYTPFVLGAMSGMTKPNSADSIEYLYPGQNHGLYLFMLDLVEYLAGRSLEHKALWPKGVRCVVSITGDVHDYTGIPGREDREWNDMKYNFDLLDEYGLEGKATYYICGEVARKHPGAIQEGLQRGYELCPHTFKETQYAIEKWDYETQRKDVLRCIEAFEKAAPGYDAYKKGFRTHGYQSDGVTRQVLRDLGYEYIGDMQAWETTGRYNPQYPEKLVNFAAFPQYLRDDGHPGLLEIPDTFANDHFVYRVMKLKPKEALEFWKEQFDKYYRLGGLFQACLHPYISLKEDPEREKTYRGLLEHILSHDGVAFMTMAEISSWWKQR